MAYGYGYGGYPGPGGYFAPPMPDQLAQLRGAPGQYQPSMMGQQPMVQPNQTMQQMSQPVQQPQTQSTILWVSSEREACEYPIAPNAAVALWDSNNPVVYIRKADASGKPDTEIYDLVQRNPMQAAPQAVQSTQIPNVEYVARADFDALRARCDAIAVELEALKNKPCGCRKKTAKEDGENENDGGR